MSYRTALTERLIQILFKLARRSFSRQELAREFEVDAKTIKRDLDALARSFPITAIKQGREVFYSYTDGYRFKPPIFSMEELATLLLAQKSIAGIGITAKNSFYAAHTDSILEKIKSSLPLLIRQNLEVLAEIYGSAQIPEKDFSKHAMTIDLLASCAARGKKVGIRYLALNTNREESRLLAPYAVYFDPDGATLKLIALDAKYDAPRVFSIDRIRHLKELDEIFIRPKNFSLKNYLEEHCFNGIHGTPVTVRLKARGITARIFAERQFHPSQQIINYTGATKTTPEEITIEMRVAQGRGLERFILSYLPDIEVVAPAELREEIRQILRTSLLPEEESKKPAAKI